MTTTAHDVHVARIQDLLDERYGDKAQAKREFMSRRILALGNRMPQECVDQGYPERVVTLLDSLEKPFRDKLLGGDHD